ncbi:four helix bundle protein [Aliarcobacter cryaerophilus]|uniref:four helix bundle protein n=1 Tax=Aliarcobacter cryaerophilus TaxID=28198 RepID=UPI003BAFA7AF
MGVSSVEDLKVFQDSHALTLALYKITKDFPSDERFGLISQIRRASSSICANMIEGSHRNNKNEYRQFVGIARGSVGELKYHLLLAKDLGYIDTKHYENIINQINSISKMLYNLIKSLEKPHTHTSHPNQKIGDF